MNTQVYASAGVSVAAGIGSWLPVLETTLRVCGSIVALVAGLLAIYIHVRTLRKGKK